MYSKQFIYPLVLAFLSSKGKYFLAYIEPTAFDRLPSFQYSFSWSAPIPVQDRHYLWVSLNWVTSLQIVILCKLYSI